MNLTLEEYRKYLGDETLTEEQIIAKSDNKTLPQGRVFVFYKSEFMSFSVKIFIPFPDRRDTVTPSPSVSVPEKVPSYMRPAPQEGLFAFIRAIEMPNLRQSESATSAPFLYSAVTSTPSRRTTFFPCLSAGILGVGSPPSCSGQTVTRVYFSFSFSMMVDSSTVVIDLFSFMI